MIITILVFLLTLSILVFVHELGHFLAARKFGASAEEFGLGFPPRLIGIYKNTAGKWKIIWWTKKVTDASDTIYSVNLIPLGGFVKIKGEDGENKNDVSSFANKPIWQRSIILAAGVVMNLILAMFIFIGIFALGSVQGIDNLTPTSAIISDRHLEIVSVSSDSPAGRADLKPGDRIISIDNQEMRTVTDVQNFVADKAGKELNYKIKRGDLELTKLITPIVLKETNRGGIGISPLEVGFIRYPWYLAVVEGAKTTGILFWTVIVALYDLLARLVTGNNVSNEVAGIVGIAVVTGQAVNLGFSYVAQLAAMLSLSLAIFNILPIPALDGGRILFLIIEKIKGRPVKQETEALVHNIGFLFLIGLMILVTYSDIKRLIS